MENTPEMVVEEKLAVKDKIDVLLKEYDSLRSQVDQGNAFLQSLVIPVSVGIAGVAIGGKDKIPLEAAVIALPVLIMYGLSVAFHGYVYVEDTGQDLAHIEDRVFQLSEDPRLLCWETKLASERHRAGTIVWWIMVFLAVIAYGSIEYFLLHALKSYIHGGNHASQVLWGVFGFIAAVPALHAVLIAFRLTKLRSNWQPTPLAKKLKEGN